MSIQILECTLSYGELGLGGRLGCEGRRIVLFGDLELWEPIGVHAPATVTFATDEPLEICGALDGSTFHHQRFGNLLFFIDGEIIGSVTTPCSATPSVIVEPGIHQLHIEVTGNNQNCHTIWLFRRSVKRSATLENTAFVSVAAFPDPKTAIQDFEESAALHGIEPRYAAYGESWNGFFRHKIVDMIPYLKELRCSGIDYVFILDCRDLLFLRSAGTILGQFNALNDGRIIFGMDTPGAFWPYYRGWYISELQRHFGSPDVNINAGCIASDIRVLIDGLEGCVKLSEQFRSNETDHPFFRRVLDDIRDTKSGFEKHFHADDQFLWQMYRFIHPYHCRLDSEKRLFAVIRSAPDRPISEPFPENGIGSASILHAPNFSRYEKGEPWNRYVRSKAWIHPRCTELKDALAKAVRVRNGNTNTPSIPAAD